MEALDLFYRGFYSFICNFDRETYYLERDIEWSIQKRIAEEIRRCGFRHTILHEVEINRGSRVYTDLVIFLDGQPVVAAELKYHRALGRADIPPARQNQIEFADYIADVNRVSHLVEGGAVEVGLAILFDEGNRFASEDLPYDAKRFRLRMNGSYVLTKFVRAGE